MRFRSYMAAGALALPRYLTAAKEPRFRVGVTDWNLKKPGEIEALTIAKGLGIDGVQVSFGAPGEGADLRQAKSREAYLRAAREKGVALTSLAMGVLNKVPYKSAPETELWVSGAIDAAEAMGLEVILLAFFSKGDLKGDAEGTAEVIRRLKKVAPRAEDAGVVLGIESWLSAPEHLHIIDAVGSPNVQVYYDVGNSTKMGYDICAEIRRLGVELICQVHAKDNAGKLFGQGKVDFWEVRRALDDIGYRGWVIIEGRTPFGLEGSYRHDYQFLRGVLGA
ncbi:MAG: sugar phosphate isomerase/epimerase family protein [Verrucomicrobiales bacterium]